MIWLVKCYDSVIAQGAIVETTETIPGIEVQSELLYRNLATANQIMEIKTLNNQAQWIHHTKNHKTFRKI